MSDKNKNPHSDPQSSTPNPCFLNDAGRRTPDAGLSCAVVVASFRPGHLINRCLHSLLAQQGIAELEVVVVDSSTNGTAERLRRDFPTVEIIGLDRQTPQSMARNIGVARTHAPFVAITDHDCVVPPDWLVRLLTHHRQGEYAAVGGAVGNGTPTNSVGTASYLIEFNEFMPVGEPRLVTMVPHCNVCFRREVFTTVGPFVEVPPGAEDLVFNFLLCQQGGRILFDPAIVVEHINRKAFLKFLRHQRLLGIGSAVARRTVALDGQIFVRYPGLACSLPLIRLLRTGARLASNNPTILRRYLMLLPILLPGYALWTAGFFAGLRRPLPVTSVTSPRDGSLTRKPEEAPENL